MRLPVRIAVDLNAAVRVELHVADLELALARLTVALDRQVAGVEDGEVAWVAVRVVVRHVEHGETPCVHLPHDREHDVRDPVRIPVLIRARYPLWRRGANELHRHPGDLLRVQLHTAVADPHALGEPAVSRRPPLVRIHPVLRPPVRDDRVPERHSCALERTDVALEQRRLGHFLDRRSDDHAVQLLEQTHLVALHLRLRLRLRLHQ